MLFAVAFLVIYSISRKKLIHKQIELNQLELKYQQELLEHYIKGTEEERKRLAADLHDDIGTRIASLKFKISGNSDILRSDLDEIIQIVRDISHNIMPASIELFGLDVSVKELTDAFNTSTTIQFSCNLKNADVLNSNTALSLYRVLQELMNNTLRHSGASQAEIHSHLQDKMFILYYADNGVGIPFHEENGIGMRSIENRLRMIGASAKWITGKDIKGMSLTIQLPVNLL